MNDCIWWSMVTQLRQDSRMTAYDTEFYLLFLLNNSNARKRDKILQKWKNKKKITQNRTIQTLQFPFQIKHQAIAASYFFLFLLLFYCVIFFFFEFAGCLLNTNTHIHIRFYKGIFFIVDLMHSIVNRHLRFFF